ncbi:hypothetical protein D3C77_261750 [compost metagenome]
MLVLPWRDSGADAALSCCSYPAEPAVFALRLDGNPAVYFFSWRSYSQLCTGFVEKAWYRRPDWRCVRRYFHRKRSRGACLLDRSRRGVVCAARDDGCLAGRGSQTVLVWDCAIFCRWHRLFKNCSAAWRAWSDYLARCGLPGDCAVRDKL